MTHVRDADVTDAAGMARVHVRAWRAAYRGGLMPDEYLDSLSVEERTEMWAESLERPMGPRRARLVGEEDTGTVSGFTLIGPEGGDDAATRGQLFVINVDPEHWGTGAGAALHDAGVEHLREFGFGRAVLWVHPDNQRARRFYERRGWRCDDVERGRRSWASTSRRCATRSHWGDRRANSPPQDFDRSADVCSTAGDITRSSRAAEGQAL